MKRKVPPNNLTVGIKEGYKATVHVDAAMSYMARCLSSLGQPARTNDLEMDGKLFSRRDSFWQITNLPSSGQGKVSSVAYAIECAKHA